MQFERTSLWAEKRVPNWVTHNDWEEIVLFGSRLNEKQKEEKVTMLKFRRGFRMFDVGRNGHVRVGKGSFVPSSRHYA